MSCSASSRLPSPTISRYADGQASQHERPRLEQRRVALLQLQPADDADDRRRRLHAVLLAQRAARLLVVVAVEVDAVVDERPRRRRPALLDDLAVDRVRDRRSGGRSTASAGCSSSWSSPERTRDEWTVEITHGRRWPASPSAIAAFVPTISARYMWLWTTSARTSTGARRGSPVAMASSGSSITRDVDARPLELADGAARRQRDDRDVVARRGPCARRGCRRAPARRRSCRSRAPGRRGCDPGAARATRRTGARQGSQPPAGRHRLSVRRTSRRWIGSSTAPHSYL